MRYLTPHGSRLTSDAAGRQEITAKIETGGLPDVVTRQIFKSFFQQVS